MVVVHFEGKPYLVNCNMSSTCSKRKERGSRADQQATRASQSGAPGRGESGREVMTLKWITSRLHERLCSNQDQRRIEFHFPSPAFRLVSGTTLPPAQPATRLMGNGPNNSVTIWHSHTASHAQIFICCAFFRVFPCYCLGNNGLRCPQGCHCFPRFDARWGTAHVQCAVQASAYTAQ
jgi:hypothetical protein